ncbi:hypothetical protein Godav_002875 [Gossypium davidsonii]|uniref:CTCHY-type domain-containing protein n=1 Tax=Gossypium davidsonii TaxID=34287 RepID=A0A7J8SXH8_GOSDV|nr:hypothetical protein [Gossypium davidsonii]
MLVPDLLHFQLGLLARISKSVLVPLVVERLELFLESIFILYVSSIYFRNVYHCPFCNLCRVGKGLGDDFFHCMVCNCCLAKKLVDHKCREKGLEINCPICCDFLFTSSESVRALPCGHFMHSACFQVYSVFLTLLFPAILLSFNQPCLIINSALFFVRHMHAVITSAQFVANRWEIWR